MNRKRNVVWFNEVDKDDIGVVGGKGANLGEMMNAGFPIPFGFIITSHAYFYLIDHNNLHKEINNYVSLINFENTNELNDGAAAIRRLVENADIPADLLREIHCYYHNLARNEAKFMRKGNVKEIMKHLSSVYVSPLVAVRSSATAEDLPGASFAGQQETFLNVQGEHELVQKIKECWASLFTERALYYRNEKKFDHMKVGLAAVVQRMVQSEKSGIAFSIEPINNDKNVIVIEAINGLGEYIVGGNVNPDHYEISKNDYSIIKNEVHDQDVKLVKRGKDNVEVKMPNTEGKKQKISNETIVEMAKIIANIEKHYYFPQDIEWAIEDNNIFIVQSRPITTMKAQKDDGEEDVKGHKILLEGSPASPGIGIGDPVIVMSPEEIGKVQDGNVLVAPMTDPDYVPAMKKAVAIVTELGGRTSHAAIVSRELGIPAVVGAQNATKILASEKEISVDGEMGKVYQGKISIKRKNDEQPKGIAHLKTLTKIYINLAQVDQAKSASKLNVDGIGLLRAEFMMADIGTHPKRIIEQGKQEEFIETLARKLKKVVKPFSPRPVIYRATDFKSNEYRHLKGGADYEPHEENPMIGFRGASRYIVWKEIFDMELEAIKRVRESGYKNLHLMIPFIRIPVELMQIKSIISQHGLFDNPSFKLWIMVEVPSTVLLLEDFIKVGIDGVSIGTNDLTMLLLGVDRDNSEVAHIYSEQNPAVLWALKRIITTARKHNVTVSVCGQAPSDYPDLAESLVRWGVTSLSLNIDAVDRTRLLIHDVEKKLWQKSKQ